MFLSRFASRRARPSAARAIRHLPTGYAARRRLRLESLEGRLALTAEFAFLLDGPAAISATPGSLVSIPVTAQIDSVLSDPAERAQGWVMCIENTTPAETDIVGATSLVIYPDDTDIVAPTDPEGVMHGVVLSLENPGQTFLPAGLSSVLSFTLVGVAPAAGVTEVWTLNFVNDRLARYPYGPLLANIVVSEGLSRDPTLSNYSIEVTGSNSSNLDTLPPSLTAPFDQTLLEDTASGLLAISVQDPGTDPNDIEIVASSSDQTLIPDGNLTLGGSGSDRTLVILPAADQHGGPVSITITASDPSGNRTSATFSVFVTPVNDAPAFTLGGDQTVPEDAGPQSVAGFASTISAGPPDESGQVLTFLVTTDNPGLFSQAPAIDSVTGALTYTPAANVNGTATVQVLLQDNGGTANGGADTSAMATFTIQVQSAAEQLAGLADAVQELVSDGALNAGQGNALAAKLAPKNNAQAQIGATTAFIQQVEALRQAGVLTDAEANALVAAAAELLNSLGNGLGSPSARRLAAHDQVFAGIAGQTPW